MANIKAKLAKLTFSPIEILSKEQLMKSKGGGGCAGYPGPCPCCGPIHFCDRETCDLNCDQPCTDCECI